MKKSEKIYDFIENFQLNEENFLVFVQTLAQYFSQKMCVRVCPIEIQSLGSSEKCLGKNPPACHKYDEVKDSEGNLIIANERIVFDEKLIYEKNVARVVKLLAHEWMHFYNTQYKLGLVKENELPEKYKKLLLKTKDIELKKMTIKEKYQNKQILACLNKLMANEVVADSFAQDFLKEVLKNVVDEKLKKQIQKEIEKHNLQIDDYHKKLKEANVEEEFVVL